MTTTRPENNSPPPPRRSDQPLFLARKREPKYFSLSGDSTTATTAAAGGGTAAPEAQRGAHERSPNTHVRAHSYGHETGIPRPATTLTGAWELAGLEEQDVAAAGGGSPSPASRRRGGNRPPQQPSRRDGRSLDLWRQSAWQSQGEEDSVGSGSLTGSMDEDGDELDRKISRFARDEERAKRLQERGDGLFTRRNVASRTTTEAGQSQQRSASESDGAAEPSVRIPAQWGRRARKPNGEWLQRIISPDSSVEVDAPGRNAKGEGDTIDRAQAAAADTPLPTVEAEAAMQGVSTSPGWRPRSVQPEKSQLWDAELDFTATSVMGSPQLRLRNTKLDEIQALERQGLSKHEVATAKLEEIRERLSEDRSVSPEVAKTTTTTVRSATRIPSPVVRNPSYLRTSTESFEIVSPEVGAATERLFGEIERAKTESERFPKEIQRGRRSGSRERPVITRAPPRPTSTQDEPDHFHERTILEEEGEQIPGTPITIFRNADRPQSAHNREDSYDTLRRLAAITSQSPSPRPTRLDDKPPDDMRRRDPVIPAPDSKRHSRSSSLPKSDVDPEERIAAEKDLFEIPDVKSERNSMREPSPVDAEEETAVEDTPRPKRDRLSMPTPVVTGAFIETPAPATRNSKIRPSSPEHEKANAKQDDKPKLTVVKNEFKDPTPPTRSQSSSRSSSRPRKPTDEASSSAPNPQIERLKPAPRSRPRLTNSAPPSSAAADLLRIQHEAEMEDSTLDDLADLLLATPIPTTAPDIAAAHAPTTDDAERDEKGRRLSAGARQRRDKERQLDKMERGLSHGLESIRDAKRGIAKLEQAVSAAPLVAAAVKEGMELPPLPEGRVVCSLCASRSSVYHLTIPLPRLWWREPSRRIGVRLTWFGLLVLLFVVWYVAESVAYERIGKPKYTNRYYDFYGPEWGWSLVRLGGNAGRWVWRIWTDGGGVKNGRSGSSTVGGGRGGVWQDGSMLEDEML